MVGPDHLYVVQFATSKDAENAFKRLANLPDIVYVEPDGYLGSSYYQEGAAEAKSWGVSAIGADVLANYIQSTNNNASIAVAVVDSGVSNHPFLSGRLLTTGYDFVDNDRSPSDLSSHGTHVAGTIVDCTPGVNVMILPVRVLDENGAGFLSTVGMGIVYATDHGADVINLSLGGTHSQYIDYAVSYAIKKGVSVVAAAGNNYGRIADLCPAHIKEVITVGAVDSNMQKAAFSNIGSQLDVVCPGVDIVSCIPGGGYKSLSGTSMAAPHASAGVALLRMINPSLTPLEIENIICSHARDLGESGRDSYYGAGLLDLTSFVNTNIITPQEIHLNHTECTLVEDDDLYIEATVLPANASNTDLMWSSSNPVVATVDRNGHVIAKTKGTSVITAESQVRICV